MKNLTKLLISFWLYFPLNLQAAEHDSMSPPAENSQTYQQVQEMPFKNFLSREDDYIYSDDYMHRLNNRTFGKDTPFELYKSLLECLNEHKKSLTMGGISAGAGHIFFHYILKKPVKHFFNFLFTEKSSSKNLKKTPWINRCTHFTHFIFDIVCAFAGYRTAQAFELDKQTGEQS